MLYSFVVVTVFVLVKLALAMFNIEVSYILITTMFMLLANFAIVFAVVINMNETFSSDMAMRYFRQQLADLMGIILVLFVFSCSFILGWLNIPIWAAIEIVVSLAISIGFTAWGLTKVNSNSLRRMEAITQITNRG